MDLIILALGIVAAFGAGALGSAAVILINDKKMAAVERVKRRILYGPEPPMIPIQMGPLDPSVMSDLLEATYKQKYMRTVSEIKAKELAASPRIQHMAKHIDEIINMTSEEMDKWLRESRSKSK